VEAKMLRTPRDEAEGRRTAIKARDGRNDAPRRTDPAPDASS
jgi:hypothetical protein